MSGGDDYQRIIAELEGLVETLGGKLRAVGEREPTRVLFFANAIVSIASLHLHAPSEYRLPIQTPPPAAGEPNKKTQAQLPVKDAASDPKKEKSAPRNTFEYAVLRWLEFNSPKRTGKQEIFAALLKIKLVPDNFSAFNTRLNNLKNDTLLTWADNKQNVAVLITSEGTKRSIELADCGIKGLTPEVLAWFEQVDWARRSKQAA